MMWGHPDQWRGRDAAWRARALGEEFERALGEIREAHTWLLAAGMCDCEDRGYEGQVRCRFAQYLDRVRSYGRV